MHWNHIQWHRHTRRPMRMVHTARYSRLTIADRTYYMPIIMCDWSLSSRRLSYLDFIASPPNGSLSRLFHGDTVGLMNLYFRRITVETQIVQVSSVRFSGEGGGGAAVICVPLRPALLFCLRVPSKMTDKFAGFWATAATVDKARDTDHFTHTHEQTHKTLYPSSTHPTVLCEPQWTRQGKE